MLQISQSYAGNPADGVGNLYHNIRIMLVSAMMILLPCYALIATNYGEATGMFVISATQMLAIHALAATIISAHVARVPHK